MNTLDLFRLDGIHGDFVASFHESGRLLDDLFDFFRGERLARLALGDG